MIRAVIILVLITFTIAFPQEFTSNESHNARSSASRKVTEVVMNDSFDENLPSIKKFILSNGMDPMEMPDYMLPFTFPFSIGKVHLQKGSVQDVVTIRRTGDIILRYEKLLMKFDFNLGWDNMDVMYDYTMRYLSIKRKGSFRGRFHNLNVKIIGSVEMKTRQIKLDLFRFIDIEDFTLKLEGHIADHLINMITKLLTVFAKERVLREIEYQSTKIINEKIKEINESKLPIMLDDDILLETEK